MAYYPDTLEDRGWGATVVVDPRRRPPTGTHAYDRGSAADYDDVTYVRTRAHRVSAPDLPPPVRFRSPVREFVAKYGWRAYALPVLVVLTVLALVTAGGDPKLHATTVAKRAVPAAPAPKPAAGGATDIPLGSDAPSAKSNRVPLKSAQLPPGGPYTVHGKGTFRVLKGTTKRVGSGQLYRYDIEVENGITGVDVAQFQRLVDTTLDDPRSWSGHGVALQRVDSGYADFHITLTSSMTVRKYCGYDIPVETSCYATADSVAGLNVNRVVLNVARWVRGATAYVGDLTTYRIYMINHEDGHALGHQHAHQCLANGLAPAMMQQTFGLRSAATGQLCQANPWPYPSGVADAPGAEQPDTPQNNEYGIAD